MGIKDNKGNKMESLNILNLKEVRKIGKEIKKRWNKLRKMQDDRLNHFNNKTKCKWYKHTI